MYIMKKTASIILAAALSLASMAEVSAANKTKQPLKEWTIAVFLNADNNLDEFGVEDQEEMSKIGSKEHMNIVTLIDREKGPAQINYIEKNKIMKIKDMGELDMGDYKEFIKFAKFIKENYPAKHYSFSFWNHGSGWRAKQEKALFRGVSYDDSSDNHITTNQLTTALKEVKDILGQKIDVINFDACLMQMVEVAYACKDYVNYMVGSEEIEPGMGAPYNDILRGVKAGITPEKFARNWATAFVKSYDEDGSQGTDDSTQSVVDLSKIDALTDALSGVAKSVMAGKYGNVIGKVVAKSQKYDDTDNLDIYSLLDQLKKIAAKDKALLSAIEKAQNAFKEAVLYSGFTGRRLKNSNGLAIFMPSDFKVEQLYKDLGFAKNSMWDEMILSLGTRVQVEKLVEGVKSGRISELKLAVSKAKRDSRNPMYRAMLQELNFLYASENAVPAQYKNEVKSLLEDMAKAIKRSN